jgi:hypothetical protein
MKNNLIFNRQDIILHPLVLGTIFLYFINNLLFQQLWPSQITGKISDFTWLFFTPIVVSSIITWLIQQKLTLKWRIDFGIWGVIGLSYTLIKTVPIVNEYIVQVIQKVTGIPVVVTIDPTDLLALISLILGFYFWQSLNYTSKRSTNKGLYALSLVTLLTLADAAAPNYGIACLQIKDDAIIATSSYMSYVSTDGGETWNSLERDSSCPWGITENIQYSEIGDKTVKARFKPGEPIEISKDDGNSWIIEYEIKHITQAQKAYYLQYREGSPMFIKGPFAAVVEPKANTILFAMGQEGILIRKPTGLWQWIRVGTYEKVDYSNPSLYFLLRGEGALALASGLLTFIVFGIKYIRDNKLRKINGTIVFTVIFYLLFETIKFGLPPALSFGYFSAFSTLAVFGILLILFTIALNISKKLRWNFDVIKKNLLFAILAAVLFLIPYFLWFFNLLPNYYFAPGFAVLTQIGVILWGWKNTTTIT